MKKILGCALSRNAADWKKATTGLPDEVENDEDDVDTYTNCALSFVPQSISSFTEEYYAIKNGFASTLPFGKTLVWFNKARRYYEKWYTMYYNKVNKNG